ncbi:uncharacterized protein cfap92 [Sphaeramia orbicularis]|uniref:uncharacterized protein cfap92 n=1 Tax=Sphaeramia orbicularis TaxID=375764 RepID=UPI00117EDF06|nr:uncharacterized protein KIAA1257 homolog [Sphaeramia orbicularis]
MDVLTVEPESGHLNSLSDCDDGGDTGQKDVLPPQRDLLSTDHRLENGSSSAEEITTHADDSSYYVTWTVYIALAFPGGQDANVRKAPEKAKKITKDSSTAVVRAHKQQGCYHVEYKLLPGDTETVKLDLLLFGPVAKLYKEDEFKILRTWYEEDLTWVGWTDSFRVRVDRNVVISLLSHKIRLQIWNSKDKLFSQAQIERLKTLRLSQDQIEDTDVCGGVKTMINTLRTMYGKKSNTKKDKSEHSNLKESSKTDSKLPPHSETQKQTSDAFDFAEIKKTGVASVEISPVSLVAGDISLINSASVCSCGVIETMYHISLDTPLLSDQLKAELNPLVISILSATSMPSSPVPFHVLEENCTPVYCQYKFQNLDVHRTNYQKHGTKIYFRDVNVILTGLLNPRDLQEFLSGPPLEVEIHDRDRKLEETPKTPASFSSRLDETAPTKQRTTVFNHHGIASLNLSELLHGKTSLKVRIPIKCCHPPPLTDGRMTDGEASSEPIPQGHYLDANSVLKVKIETACPLNVKNDGCESESYEPPFGRIIYLFNYNNISVTTKLRSEILTINAEAFQLGSRSLENIERALSNYTLNFKCNESQDLDFVTGFHVLDKRTQIFVLEGLKHKAVRRLWEAIPMKLSGSEEEQVIVFYNSSLAFFRRIYDSLDMGLTPILLSEPLETIMREPLVYVRGTVPDSCFQALSRLSQLCGVRNLRNVVQYNLFPSADMILSLSKEYGTCADQRRQRPQANPQHAPPPVHRKRHKHLDANNIEYIKWKLRNQHMTLEQPRDFVQDNIIRVHELSEQLQKPEVTVLRMEEAAERPVHNYSIQTFNSNRLNKEQLQREMAKMPGRRFTYSQLYHSATAEPGDATPKPDPRSTAPTRIWFSTMRSDESKLHCNHPDEARVEELRKPWRENILHANILNPTLTRDRWAWDQRSQDFELYSKAPPFFSTPPVTIHQAGNSLHQEQTEAASAQYKRWLNKLLPSNSNNDLVGNGLVPEFKCHMGGTEKFQSILKDKPMKYSLRKPGLLLRPIPQLSVINSGDDRAEVKEAVALAPGPCLDCSLSSKNIIPRHSCR